MDEADRGPGPHRLRRLSFADRAETDQPTPSRYDLILRIRSSFTQTAPDLPTATTDHVCYTAMQLRRWSPTLSNVPIKTALYDLRTGAVTEVTCGRTRDAMLLCRTSR